MEKEVGGVTDEYVILDDIEGYRCPKCGKGWMEEVPPFKYMQGEKAIFECSYCGYRIEAEVVWE